MIDDLVTGVVEFVAETAIELVGEAVSEVPELLVT